MLVQLQEQLGSNRFTANLPGIPYVCKESLCQQTGKLNDLLAGKYKN
jgi:hypothetical protein